jgi:CcmD family protein
MTCVTRFVVALVLAVSWSSVAGAQPSGQAGQPGQSPQQQSEFIPIDQLPPQDRLPAAPLLIAAYSIVLIVLAGYLLSVSRRLTTVQREVDRLERDVKKSGRT